LERIRGEEKSPYITVKTSLYSFKLFLFTHTRYQLKTGTSGRLYWRQ
jgi:hypothetical protein